MLAATAVARAQPAAARFFSSTVRANGAAVAVLGGAGGIGQPLSLLMKQSPLVSDLRVYDLANSVGVAADLSHINTAAKVRGFAGKEQLAEAVRGADVIVIPAGVPRKPNMTRDDLFNTNASIVASLAAVCAKEAPKAQMLIISNPVNSTVPIVAEIYKRVGAYDPARLFGVTTLDVTRARTFVGALKNVDPVSLKVPVIGGHAGITILPLLSQNSAKVSFTEEELASLTHRIQFGGDEVVKAKAGTGSATLSMAYAGAEFANAVIRGLNGEQGVVECAFVQSNAVPGLSFFSTQVELGRNGVSKIRGTGNLTPFEAKKLEELKAELKASIDKGVAFGTSFAL